MNEEIWEELYALRRKTNKAERRIRELETAVALIAHNVDRICITQAARLPGDFLNLVRESIRAVLALTLFSLLPSNEFLSSSTNLSGDSGIRPL